MWPQIPQSFQTGSSCTLHWILLRSTGTGSHGNPQSVIHHSDPLLQEPGSREGKHGQRVAGTRALCQGPVLSGTGRMGSGEQGWKTAAAHLERAGFPRALAAEQLFVPGTRWGVRAGREGPALAGFWQRQRLPIAGCLRRASCRRGSGSCHAAVPARVAPAEMVQGEEPLSGGSARSCLASLSHAKQNQ